MKTAIPQKKADQQKLLKKDILVLKTPLLVTPKIQNPLPLFKYMVFNGNNSQIIRDIINSKGCFQEIKASEDNCIDFIDFIWKPNFFTFKFYLRLEKINKFRDPYKDVIINHLENMKSLVTKNGLTKSMRKFYKTYPEALEYNYTISHSMATTFIVTAGGLNKDYQRFIQRFCELNSKYYFAERMPSKHCQKNIWLVKPSAQNQGRGIQVFETLSEIKNCLDSKPLNTLWIIQKYIERPLLLNDRKFDIRVWALITFKNELYFYPEGYIRTSSDIYTLNSLKENYIHLTNNCLQKFGKKYGMYEEGNTLSFADLKIYLKSNFPNIPIDFNQHILSRIKDLIIDSFLACKNEINPSRRKNCFELLGYDFLIDEDFRVWLIEVNHNPYLGIPNKFIARLLPKMLEDLFGIVLDPFIHMGYPQQNGFELLYYDKGPEKNRVNKRRSYRFSPYPLESLEPIPNPLPGIKEIISSIKNCSSNTVDSIQVKSLKKQAGNLIRNIEYVSQNS